jgi:uncharacterized protein (DUF885 family)
MKSIRWVGGAEILLVLALVGCQHSAPKSEAEAGWDNYVEGYLERYFAANPSAAVSAGRHEWDGQLPDWSKEGIANEIARLKAETARAEAIPDSSLDARQKFERGYVLAVTAGQLFWLETAEGPFTNPQFYSWTLDPNVYVSREYAPAETRLKSFIKYAHAVPKACDQIQANLRLPMARPLLDQGKLILGGLASYIEKDAVSAFASVKDDGLQKELKDASAEASRSLKAVVAWLDGHRVSATSKFALGKDRFQKMLLDTEKVSVPIATIEKAGRADLERNLQELSRVCVKFAPGASLKKCVAKEESEKPKDAPVEAAKKQLDELKSFVKAKDFVSIPGTEIALVAESPPYMRWNFAYIDIPGPYEKGLSSTYYISPPDPKWSKKEQEAYIPGQGSLLDTSVHEVWPGHFLQFLHANRASSKFGRVFVSYAFAEGWAHYVEQLMSELELEGGKPEVRIGQILGALLRDVRLLSAIGLHTGKMTQKQSEQMFREKGLMDPGSAKQQAARGTFDPAYLNYTMGKLMIRKLRDDWSAARCGKEAQQPGSIAQLSCWKKFHDEFLAYGGPPIPLVRASMLGSGDSGQLF